MFAVVASEVWHSWDRRSWVVSVGEIFMKHRVARRIQTLSIHVVRMDIGQPPGKESKAPNLKSLVDLLRSYQSRLFMGKSQDFSIKYDTLD